MKIGLIGTGLMGAELGKKIVGAGYMLNIYNRSKSKTGELIKLGAKFHSDVNKLINDSDSIILMLSDYDAICNVLFNSYNGQFEGKTIIQMGTIAPLESKDVNKRIYKLRGKYFEAPVLGSINQIINSKLIVLVGGDEVLFDKYQKMFSLFSNKILHIGDIGKASAMKLALNQLIVSETVAFSMSLGYVLKNNLDVENFMSILRDSALFAPTFDKKLPNMLERNFKNPNFPLKHLLKDLDLILAEFSECNINTNSLKSTRKILIDSIQNGFADHDYSALYNGINPEEAESHL